MNAQFFRDCYKCPDRRLGCHSVCEKYLSAKAKLADVNAVKYAIKEFDTYAIESIIKHSRKDHK